MRRLGIIVSGSYDCEVIPVLAKKCRNGVKVTARQCKGPVLGKVHGIIQELERCGEVEGIIIVEDADNNKPTDLKQKIMQKINEPGKRQNALPIKVAIAVQKMEAWLLADPRALASVLKNQVQTQAFPQPDDVPDPKAALEHILFEAKRNYTRKIAREIAEAADIEKIAKCSPSFYRFREIVATI